MQWQEAKVSLAHAHGAGDGARSIAKQMKQRFGSHNSYLLYFYQVCGYRSEARMDKQKQRLKGQGLGALPKELQGSLGPEPTPDEDAPVRRY